MTIRWALALLAMLACGKKPAAAPTGGSDGPPISTGGSDATIAPGSDAAVPVFDAPPLAACTPVHGTTLKATLVAGRCGATFTPPNCTQDTTTLATSPPNDGRLFLLERRGAIRIFYNNVLEGDPFLDISDDNGGPVVANNELGLLGLAFHPSYATNRQLYVFYTAVNPANQNQYLDIVARYTANATNPDIADPASATIILSIPDPFANHNGGMIQFGPDGYLYIGTGDGGNEKDPLKNGQNPNTMLSKILRIDVDHPANGMPYGIPADNPYADGVGGLPETYISGLRNPWRWSIDMPTGDMWIADVGQDTIEELDYLPAGKQAGTNLGWSMYEGSNCFRAPCDPTGMTFPIHQRTHASGWSAIIGGQVYRGSCFPDLQGWYIFSDYAARIFVRAQLQSDGSLTVVDQASPILVQPPSSIHADARGELYMTNSAGQLLQITAGP